MCSYFFPLQLLACSNAMASDWPRLPFWNFPLLSSSCPSLLARVHLSHQVSCMGLTQHLLEDFLVLTGPFSMPLIKNKALLTPLTISWVIQMFSRLQFPPVHVNSTSHPHLSFRAPDFISRFLISISTWTSGAQAPSRVAGSCSAHWGYFSSGARSLHA